MKKNTHSSEILLDENKSKDKQFRTQFKAVFVAFYKEPKTMKMVESETGIDRANICRYVGKWHESKSIQIYRWGTCLISKENGVQFLTTNPQLFTKEKVQLELFDND